MVALEAELEFRYTSHANREFAKKLGDFRRAVKASPSYLPNREVLELLTQACDHIVESFSEKERKVEAIVSIITALQKLEAIRDEQAQEILRAITD
jgi:hypothetical protein